MDLPPPIQMCDAHSRNVPKLVETLVENCNAHNRRNFVKVTVSFPEPCRFVLEALGEVYGNDAVAREQAMSPEERLRFQVPRPHLHRLRYRKLLNLQPPSGSKLSIVYSVRRGARRRICQGRWPSS